MRKSTTLPVAAVIAVMMGSEAMASGRAMCPEAGVGWGKDVGIIATKSNDMEGEVYARGATRCTIKFYDTHKAALIA
jgi:hypothetical protein